VSTPPVILTVCLGNICRSPTAEAALREAASEAGVELEVRSAGTGGWHVGESADPRQLRAAAAAGLAIEGIAVQLTPDDLEEADLVLVMDRSNLADVRDLAAATDESPPIRLLRSYDPTSVEAGELEVPDPYGGGPDGFDETVRLCRAAAREVVAAMAGHRSHPADA
jgi:protein-tyrosine phosphatase